MPPGNAACSAEQVTGPWGAQAGPSLISIWHIAGGRLTEFWAFAEDQADLDKFFS